MKNQLPKIKVDESFNRQEKMDSGEIDPEFIDVFCEKNIFEENSTLEILKVAPFD